MTATASGPSANSFGHSFPLAAFSPLTTSMMRATPFLGSPLCLPFASRNVANEASVSSRYSGNFVSTNMLFLALRSSVRNWQGSTKSVLIPREAVSWLRASVASVSVRMSLNSHYEDDVQRRAALEAQYAPTAGYDSHAAIEPMLTITPSLRLRKRGRNALVVLIVPKTLVVNCEM